MALVRKSRSKVDIAVIFFLHCIDFFAYIINSSNCKQNKALGKIQQKDPFFNFGFILLKLPTIFRPFP